MRADVRFRVAVAGAELRMLVLATQPTGCVGVDLDSGAFVRARHPGDAPARMAPFDVVTAALGDPLDPPDPSQPEAVVLHTAPRRVGRVGRRRAGRYLQPLHHPPQAPLLGFAGARTPYWTLTGDRPSLALVVPDDAPHLRATPAGWECRFSWLGAAHHLPLAHDALLGALERLDRRRVGGRDLARLLGCRPGRLLVVLSPPRDGYCWKDVAALLPGS